MEDKTMTVVCEECGKVYRISPTKLEQFKGSEVNVKCDSCGHVIHISKIIAETSTQDDEEAEDYFETEEDLAEGLLETAGLSEPGDSSETDADFDTDSYDYEEPESQDSSYSAMPELRTRGWLGLKGKMFILFLLIPIVLMAVSGYISQHQMKTLATEITEESTNLVLQEGAEKLMQKARDVALQCEIYLKAHPDLEREDFSYDPEFSGIAVQTVGKTGYTDIFQEPDEDQYWTIWAHPNPNIIGIDDVDMIRKALGPHFDDFWNVLVASQGRKESQGFYSWKDPDGKIRDKYMAVAPIRIENSPFFLMSTAYIDEFTQKTESLKKTASKMTKEIQYFNLFVLFLVMIIIGLCILIYGYRLTKNIQYLTEAADRISVGDLDTEIRIKSNDEIGNLADAISRMQDSLRFSIERLKRRRS